MMNFRISEKESPKAIIDTLDLKQLLGRAEVSFDIPPIKQFLKGRRILITGAAGSVGTELYRQITLAEPSELTLIDQSSAIIRWPFDLPQSSIKLNQFVVNICDRSTIHHIFDQVRPDLVFHAAALKDVPLVESMHREAVHVNIIGTEIIAQAALQTGVQKFVFVSTDKAVNPTSFMGATKRFGEMIMHRLTGAKTEFVTTRFGNILGSSGSVIPLFLDQLRHDNLLKITHPDMTRYFMTTFEAGQLLLQTGMNGKDGQIFVPRMGAPVHITDLADRLLHLLGRPSSIKFSGIRPGEKLHEELLNEKDPLIPSYHPEIHLTQLDESEMPDVDKFLSLFKTALLGRKNDLFLPLLMSAVPGYLP